MCSNCQEVSDLDLYLANQEKKKQDFLNALEKTPPLACDFKVGDKVIYTNDYGVEFDLVVKGFDKLDQICHGRFIYVFEDAYWFSVRAEQLRLKEYS